MIKITSLETSKLLKGAAFRQDTYWQWSCNIKCENNVLNAGRFIHENFINIAAPTTDELLEELPIRIKFFDGDIGASLSITLHDDGIKYFVYYAKNISHVAICHSELSESLPEALAQMWLWLKKEGLLEDWK